MIHSVRRMLVAFPLGLLLAGCGVSDRAQFRSSSAAGLSAPATSQGAILGMDRSAPSRGDARQASRPNERVTDGIGPQTPHDITLNEIREYARNESAMIVDARGPGDFALGHVNGALNMPPGQEDRNMGELWQRVAPSELIIVYCNGPRCNSSDLVREYLVSQGFMNVRVFKPGWKAIAAVYELW